MNHNYIKTLALILCFFFYSQLYSQSNTVPNTNEVIGRVINLKSEILPFVLVSVQGTTNGIYTDDDGMFKLTNVAQGRQTILVSGVGVHFTSVQVDIAAEGITKVGDIKVDDQHQLAEVEVVGKTEIRRIKEQSFTVNVVDLKSLYNTTTDLNEALNRVSGVRIREDGGVGSNFNFSLNGFSGRQVRFFIDGIPMDNFGSSLTLNNYPATMAERIEVYKGVLPISLGTDALGGAINVVTRSNPNFVDVSYGFGSFNTHKASLNGAYTHKESGFTARVNAFYNYSDNNYKVEVSPIDFTSGQKGPLQKVKRFHDNYESVGIQIEAGVVNKSFADRLLVGLIASENDKDIQTGVTMEQVFGARTSNSNSLVPTLKYKKSDLLLEGLSLNVYGAYNMTNNNFIDTTRLKYNWLQETIHTSAAELSRTQLKNKDNEGLVSSNLSYAINNNNSISYNYLTTHFKRKSSDVENPDNVTFLYPQSLQKQTMGLGYQGDYKGMSFTAFGKYYILHAKSFENVSKNPVPDYQTTSIEKDNFGYGTALSYFILPSLQVKGSYEHTYRLPEATELLGDGLYVRRNSALKPESSDNLNLSALYTFEINTENKLNIEGNFISRHAKDYIRQDQGQVQPIDRQYINVGKVRTTGVEAEVRYSWQNRLFVGVNMTYQDVIDRTKFLTSTNLSGTIVSKNLNYNYRLPNIPYLFGNANVGTQFQNVGTKGNSLNLNYSMSYVKEYFLTPNQLGANNSDKIPQQVSHNLAADYSIKNGRTTVTLECRNLADNKLYDNYLLQNPGRSFSVKLRYFISR